MVKINRKSLGRLPFPVVRIQDQEALLAGLSQFDEALYGLDSEAERIASLRTASLSEVFGGS